jgi:hypothetical protein
MLWRARLDPDIAGAPLYVSEHWNKTQGINYDYGIFIQSVALMTMRRKTVTDSKSVERADHHNTLYSVLYYS